MKKILVSLAVLWCVALGVQAQDNQEYEKQVAKMLESYQGCHETNLPSDDSYVKAAVASGSR